MTDFSRVSHGFMLSYEFYKLPTAQKEDKEHIMTDLATQNLSAKIINDVYSSNKGSFHSDLYEDFPLPCGCQSEYRNKLPVIQSTKEVITSSFPWLATIKVSYSQLLIVISHYTD